MLLQAGQWREDAGQIQKPPFEEVTAVAIEHHRDKDTGVITTTDMKLSHADKLMVREDGGEYRVIPIDQPFVSEAMVLEFRAVDSTGTNKEGKPYRIDNTIDLQHALIPAAKAGYQVVKVSVVPPSAKLLFTTDGSNPANNGKPYAKPGIEVAEGTTVRLFAEKAAVSVEKSVPIPKAKRGRWHGRPWARP